MKKRRPSQARRRNPANNNAAVKFSLDRGNAFGEYIGRPPVFGRDPNYDGDLEPAPVVMLEKGVPFVRQERQP